MSYSTTIALLVAMLVLTRVLIQLQTGVLYQPVEEFVDPSAVGTAVSLASVTGVAGALTGWRMVESGVSTAPA